MKKTMYWNELEMLTQLNLGEKQQKFIEWQKEHYTDIKVTPLKNLPIDVVNSIKKFAKICNFKRKECYSNACKFVINYSFVNKVNYCEGKVHVNGISIDHAWVHIYLQDGTDFYFDPTNEFLFPNENIFKDYVKLIEFDKEKVYDKMLNTKYYGNWWNEEFIEDYEKNY